MNRRSFFRTIAKGVLASAATFYAPRALFEAVEESRPMTLLEWAQRRDPNGGASAVAEILAAQNDILDDMVFCDPPKGYVGGTFGGATGPVMTLRGIPVYCDNPLT